MICKCSGSKCLGLNGYNFSFIKDFWHLFKPFFIKVLDEFHVNGVILKVEMHFSLPCFLRRTILIGCVYKVIAKILSNRLKESYGKSSG